MGFLKKNRNILVMDGTNKYILNEILGVFGMIAYPNGGKFSYKPMESNSSIIHITSKMSDKNFQSVQDILDLHYPGLCTYPTAV